MEIKTEQELKQELTRLIARSREEACPSCGEPIECDNPEHTARDIVDLFKQAGYVRLAEDQSLPVYTLDKYPDYFMLHAEQAQQDMLKANFRKVE